MGCGGRWYFIFFILLLVAGQAFSASNQSLVYQGRIARPDGTPPNSGTLTFTLAVFSPSPSKCLLYSETQTVNMTGSQGMFSLNLGGGTRTDSGSHTFNQVFVNGTTFNGLTCASGSSYTAGPTDDRSLQVSFNDSGTVVNLSAMDIKSVPFALQAHEIDGWALGNLVKVSNVGSATTFTTAEMAIAKVITGLSCANNEILKWSGGTWICGSDATGGSPGDASYAAKGIVQFDTDAATSGISVASGVATVNFGAGANQIVKLDASSKLPAVDGSALTNLNAASIASGTLPISRGGTGQVTKTAAFDALSPNTTKGDLIVSDGTNNIRLPRGSDGQVLTTDSAQASGVKWTAASSGTLTNVTAGAGLNVGAGPGGSITSTGTLNIDIGTGANQIVQLTAASKLPAVDGSLLTNLDASQISTGTLPVSKGGTGSGAALTNNKVMVSSGGAIVEGNGFGSTKAANTFVTRDASGNFAAGTGTFDSVKLSGSTSGTLTFTVPTSFTGYSLNWPTADGSAGQFLKTDGAGNLSWATSAAPGDASYAAKGIVQFDTDAATSGISVASGVATVNFGTGANQIVKLDASSKLPAVDGSALTNLNAASIASGTLPISRGGTGIASFAANNLVGTNGTGTVLQAVTCSQNQIISFDASGKYGCYNLSTIAGGTYFANGGNSFGGAATLGTSDNYGLSFKTNDRTAMSVSANGQVGIGAASAREVFEVKGGARILAPSASTTVSGAHDNTTTTITVASTADYPSSGTLKIGSEVVTYTGKTATTFTGVTRGFFGTSAAAISNGTIVEQYAFMVEKTGSSVPGFLVSNAGHVGIGGYPNPEYSLYVLGESRVDGTMLVEAELAGGSTQFVLSNQNVQNNGSPKFYFTGYDNYTHPVSGDEVGTLGWLNGATYNVGAKIVGVAAENHDSTATGMELQFHTTPLTSATPVQRMVIAANGKVGIGVGATSPSAHLEITGQVRSVSSTGAAMVNGTTTIDWDNGNAQSMSVACTSTTLDNMLDGGTYILAVTETGTTQCAFSSTGLTFYFNPANAARTSGARTVYTFQRIGNDVYVSWSSGFQ